MHLRPGSWGLVCVWLSLALSSAAAQRTIQVPLEFNTIQEAIDAASNNDTIRVLPGVYRENIDLKGKIVRLVSANGPLRTIIDGQRRGSVVTFSGGETRSTAFIGFTLVNGTGTTDRFFRVGGGIYCRNASPTIWGVVVEHNRVIGAFAYGGGIYVNGGDPKIVECVIAHNESSSWGGGICTVDSPAHITRCTIQSNRSDQGGGILCSGSAPTVTNSVLMKNEARNGGGIYAALGAPVTKTFTNNTIVGNKATQFGGGFASASDTSSIANTILWNNVAPQGAQLWLGRDCSACVPSTVTIDHSVAHGGSKAVFQQSGAKLVWGAGMIDADPLLADPTRNDAHLRYTSPCRDRGSGTVANLPTEDLDGAARVFGGAVDIGADEFAPQLYLRGKAYLGTTLNLAVAGMPGTPVVWAVSIRLANPPIQIPGIGTLYLDPSSMTLNFPGLVPGTGVVSISMPIPKTMPIHTLPFQALSTGKLTNHVFAFLLELE